MALFNEILVGRFNRGIQKLFGIKGGPPAAQLSSEIAVNHQLASGSENRYLEGWNLVSATYQTAVTAGGASAGFRFRNPATSNAVAVIISATYYDILASPVNGLGTFVIGVGGDLGTAQAAPTTWDPRFGVGSVLIVSSSITSPAALTSPAVIKFFSYPANVLTTLLEPQVEVPLLPGRTLQITSDAQTGSQPLVNVTWRERFLEDSERF